MKHFGTKLTSGVVELMLVELVAAPQFRNYGTPINEWPTVVAEK